MAAQVAVGAILLIAGIAKGSAVGDFEFALARQGWLPRGAVASVARLVILAEVAAGACLLVGILTVPAAGVASGLSAGFVATVVAMLVRGKRDGCACFGDETEQASILTLLRALVIGASAISVLTLTQAGVVTPTEPLFTALAFASGLGLALGLRVITLAPSAVRWMREAPSIDGSLATRAIDLSHFSPSTSIFGPYPAPPRPLVVSTDRPEAT